MANQARSRFQHFTTFNLKEYIRLTEEALASRPYDASILSFESELNLYTEACEEYASRSRRSWWYPIARLFA